MNARKNPILEITGNKINESFTVQGFDLQYTKVLNNDISYLSNLIREKFKVNWFRGSLFILAMEISIIFKDTL